MKAPNLLIFLLSFFSYLPNSVPIQTKAIPEVHSGATWWQCSWRSFSRDPLQMEALYRGLKLLQNQPLEKNRGLMLCEEVELGLRDMRGFLRTYFVPLFSFREGMKVPHLLALQNKLPTLT